jgi:hypothetical protein
MNVETLSLTIFSSSFNSCVLSTSSATIDLGHTAEAGKKSQNWESCHYKTA